MRSLEEVIKAWSICFSDNSRSDCTGCPYADEDGDAACFNHDREDALHYLKEYQAILPLVPSLINTAIAAQKKGKTIEDLYHDAVNELAELKNQDWKDRCLPLTWDELQTMEGKPVWVEKSQDDEPKGWLLILQTNQDVVNCTTKHGNSFYLYRTLYDGKWQAYRKERSA